MNFFLNKSSGEIPIFWYSMPILHGHEKENFGDMLSKYIVEKISGKNVVHENPLNSKWYKPDRKVYFAIGSILHIATKKTIVWGSGMIQRKDKVKRASFLAVRGPVTRQILISQGHKVPQVYGDPAILISSLYNPQITESDGIGIVPHFKDFALVSKWYRNQKNVKVIDLLNNDVEEVLNLICSCEFVLTSSLHGLIVAHSYGIPAVWVKFSNKLYGDNMKFDDYFGSVEMPSYKPEFIENKYSLDTLESIIGKYPANPASEIIDKIKIDLMKVCPFHVEII